MRNSSTLAPSNVTSNSFSVLLSAVMAVFLLVTAASAQTTAFSYQGSLKDGANAANGNYDLEFRLYDAAENGTQVGSTVSRPNTPVANGVFAVQLDFGANFPGAGRWLQISARQAGTPTFQLLQPRAAVNSVPYAVQSLNAGTANNALSLGGVAGNQYVQTTDARMTDARSPLPGSANYIQNGTVTQASSNFSISGDGTAGGTLRGNIVTATSGFNIGSTRVLSIPGTNNTMVGDGAGNGIFSSGTNNTFVGFSAGDAISSGSFNTFLGSSAGADNTTGLANSFFGALAGTANTSGIQNSFFGRSAGAANTTADGNSFFGAYSGSVNTSPNNSFFGSLTGLANTSGSSNSFFGADAGKANSVGNLNSFFGRSAGVANKVSGNSFFGAYSGAANSVGVRNSFFGYRSGEANTVGTSNSFYGDTAGVGNVDGVGNSFFGEAAGSSNVSGAFNAFFGRQAGFSNVSGDNNTFVGNEAGKSNTGRDNVYIGYLAGSYSAVGNYNTFVGGFTYGNESGSRITLLGYGAGVDSGGLSYATAIGAGAKAFYNNSVWIGRRGTGSDPKDKVYIGGSLDVGNGIIDTDGMNVGTLVVSSRLRTPLYGIGSESVCRSSDGYLSLCFSSLRYKNNVATFIGGLDVVKRLRPITFDWIDSGIRDLGLGAEDVAAVEPLLARYGMDGKPEGVKYDRIGVVLINAVKEQQKQIEAQRDEIRTLRAALCELNPRLGICGPEGNK